MYCKLEGTLQPAQSVVDYSISIHDVLSLFTEIYSADLFDRIWKTRSIVLYGTFPTEVKKADKPYQFEVRYPPIDNTFDPVYITFTKTQIRMIQQDQDAICCIEADLKERTYEPKPRHLLTCTSLQLLPRENAETVSRKRKKFQTRFSPCELEVPLPARKQKKGRSDDDVTSDSSSPQNRRRKSESTRQKISSSNKGRKAKRPDTPSDSSSDRSAPPTSSDDQKVDDESALGASSDDKKVDDESALGASSDEDDHKPKKAAKQPKKPKAKKRAKRNTQTSPPDEKQEESDSDDLF